jgi:hypothetical protein
MLGNVDLVMWPMESTTSCTIANMKRDPTGREKPKSRLKPSATTRIEVTWQTKTFENEYSKGCTVGTNDPERPMFSLRVKGFVDPNG